MSDRPIRAALDQQLAVFSSAVDSEMRARIDAAVLPAELAGMLRYHLGWADEQLQPIAAPGGGKHVRPALCLLACQAAGGGWEQALPSAVAVEMVHNFSLIHDDIEDVSPLRRHRPTVWALWGVALAINVGDALLIEAQQALLASRAPADRQLLAARLLGAACRALCGGQHLDLSPGAAPPSLDAYYQMIGGKTAALLAAAAELGALAAGAEPARRESYARFGRELGLAFQVQDDLLDVWGATSHTGKPAREDLRYVKRSYPIALAYERAAPARRALLDQLCGGEPPLPDETVDAVVALLDGLDIPAAGQGQVRAHHQAALAALEQAAPQPEAGDLLVALAEMLLHRDS